MRLSGGRFRRLGRDFYVVPLLFRFLRIIICYIGHFSSSFFLLPIATTCHRTRNELDGGSMECRVVSAICALVRLGKRYKNISRLIGENCVSGFLQHLTLKSAGWGRFLSRKDGGGNFLRTLNYVRKWFRGTGSIKRKSGSRTLTRRTPTRVLGKKGR